MRRRIAQALRALAQRFDTQVTATIDVSSATDELARMARIGDEVLGGWRFGEDGPELLVEGSPPEAAS